MELLIAIPIFGEVLFTFFVVIPIVGTFGGLAMVITGIIEGDFFQY